MKTYGVAITAGGTTYYFHIETTVKVKELIEGSTDITALVVTEETYIGTTKEFRTLSDSEILWNIIMPNTARTLEEKALPRLLQVAS
jgi:hypothetical protein